MRSSTLRRLAGFAGLLASVMVAAPAPAATAPVAHRTVFATNGGTLYRLTLSSTGAVTARAAVSGGRGAVAADYDGRRLVFIRAGAARTDDQVWIRETSGASRFLAMGGRAIFTPGRTGVVVSRYVEQGRSPGSRIPEHDELSVVRLSDGHVFRLSPHEDGYVTARMRNSRDGAAMWLLTGDRAWGEARLERYDRATDTISRPSSGFLDCNDLEVLPSGTNALAPCGRELWTVRLATGAVIHRFRLPVGGAVSVDGRLNTTTYLLSMANGSGRWLAAVDLATLRVRTLSGSAGYSSAVVAY